MKLEMIKTVLMLCMIAESYAGFSSSSAAGASSGLYNNIQSNVYADKYPYVGFGGGGGYTSNYVGTGSNPFFNGFAQFAPLPQLPNPYFNGNSQFEWNNRLFQQFQSNFANLWQQQLAHQAAIQNSVHYPVRNPGVYGGTYTSTSTYPGHSVHTVNRFGDGSSGGGVQVSHSSGRPGFQGLSSSSFSSSSDVNGIKSGHQESITSINDNGKITTYRVGSKK